MSHSSRPPTAPPARSPVEHAFVGEYLGGGVDSASRLLVLDDGTFCFSFVGGSLDWLAAGRWRLADDGASIELREVRPVVPAFWVWARESAEPSDHFVIELDGYSLSEATAPALAVSSDPTLPSELRPMFADDMSSWASEYRLPPMAKGNARYLFIGSSTMNTRDEISHLEVLRFDLRTSDGARVAFNRVHGIAPFIATARLVEGSLYLDDEALGRPAPVAEELAEQVREACIRPRLEPGHDRPDLASRGDPALEDDAEPAPLTPEESFRLEPAAVRGKPWVVGG